MFLHPRGRWHHLFQNHVLPDHERPFVEITNSDRLGSAGKVPKTTYMAASVEPSMPTVFKDKIMEVSSREWANHRPEDLWKQADANTLALQDGGLEIAQNAWYSLMAEPLTFVKKQGADIWGIVWYASEFGVHIIRTVGVDNFEGYSYFPIPTSAEAIHFHTVTKNQLHLWLVKPARIMPPGLAKQKLRGNHVDRLGHGCVFQVSKTQAFESMLAYASRFAYRAYTKEQVIQICKDQEVALPRPKPRAEGEWVDLLMSSARPETTQALRGFRFPIFEANAQFCDITEALIACLSIRQYRISQTWLGLNLNFPVFSCSVES